MGVVQRNQQAAEQRIHGVLQAPYSEVIKPNPLYRAPDKRGLKGISALIFWNSALKIKLKGENTLCILRFQCWY